MMFPNPRFWSLGNFRLWLVLSLVIAVGPVVCGQTLSESKSSFSAERVKIGFGGVIRLGHVVPFYVRLDARQFPPGSEVEFRVTASDDADVPVVWQMKSVVEASSVRGLEELSVARGLFRVGRPFGKITFGMKSAGSETIEQFDVELSEKSGIQVVDGTATLVVAAGLPAGFVQQIPAKASGMSSIVVVSTDDPLTMPVDPTSLESVSRIVLGGTGSGWLEQLGEAQFNALDGWVRRGGRLLLMSGDMTPIPPRLRQLVPGQLGETRPAKIAPRMEFFSESREQLQLPAREGLASGESLVTGIDPHPGAVDILADRARVLMSRQAAGFGQVTWSAIALDHPDMQQWKGLPRTIARLLFESAGASRNSASPGFNATSQKQFGDLSNQLRMGLENFTSVRPFAFTSIALMAGLAVLLLGVGDYFLVRRVLRKPVLTWLTFPLITAGICWGAWGLHRMTVPADGRHNCLEILDIDIETGFCRGSKWNCVFFPRPETATFEVSGYASWINQPVASLNGWHGQPGRGLGGMQTRTGLTIFPGDYVQNLQINERGIQTDSSIQGMSFSPASARTLFCRYYSTIDETSAGSVGSSKLRQTRSMNQLKGSFVNPLPVTIRGCRLYFDGDCYLVQRDFGPGQVVDILETELRTSKSILARREKIEDKRRNDLSVVSPWSSGEKDLRRVAEMIMFHSEAGGIQYTGLGNDYYDQLEMSELAGLNRAVLFGIVDEPVSRLNVASSGSGSMAVDDQSTDQRLNLVRIVFPVTIESR